MSSLAGRMSTGSPWGRSMPAVLAANAVGSLLLLTGWWGGAREVTAGPQLGWANLAGIGVLLAVAADAAWLLRGRRAVRGRAHLLLTSDALRPGTPPRTATRQLEFAAVAGMLRYHRRDCRLIVGKVTAVAPRRVHEEAGREPCGVCGP